jgi:hypothetical protein
MGLLDDALREHLELKRLRGADPGLVSREESEVFGPVRGGEPGADNGEIGAPEPPAHEDPPPTGHDPAQPKGFSNVGQETAEIDMLTVLEGDLDQEAAPAGPVVAQPVAGRPRSRDTSPGRRVAEDSLEWEMPGKGSDEGNRAGGDSQDEPVEDVLEETPDFLRDTPEQERLWFEQRPPRDFDFDK